MANEYASVSDLKKTLELSGETFADPDLRLALTAASRGVDTLTRRRFWVDEDATSVRYYTPDTDYCLSIDDLVELTSLKTDATGGTAFADTWTENEDFTLLPLNASVDGEPWTGFDVIRWGQFRLPCGYGRSVQVTGKFGWPAVPEEITLATVMLATRLMRRAREAPFGVISIGTETAMRIGSSDPDIMGLVGRFIRKPVVVA